MTLKTVLFGPTGKLILSQPLPGEEWRRRWRIVPYRLFPWPFTVVSSAWDGPWPEPPRPDDDLVAFIDPEIDRQRLGRFVNELRDAGHEVEITWPVG